MTSNDHVLDVSHVDKRYAGTLRKKGVHALRGVSMRVERGSIFGLLGPNGAGKSTLVKVLMTVIHPTECRGTMLGKPIGDKATLRGVGYLPEHHRFPEYLTGPQVLDYFGALSEVDRATRKRRSAELLELVGLGRWTKQKVKSFSKGMRQRLGIANALMSDPEFVVLDEPTDGVDPVGRRDIRNVLNELKSRGKTVFLNSHLLSELEMVCDRVAIMVQGKVWAQGTIDELTRADRRYEIEIDAGEQGHDARLIAGAIAGAATLELPQGVTTVGAVGATPPISLANAMVGTLLSDPRVPVVIDRGTIRVGTDEASAVQPIIDLVRARGWIVRAVRPVRPSLEDLFMKAVTDPVTGRVLGPGAAEEDVKGAGRLVGGSRLGTGRVEAGGN